MILRRSSGRCLLDPRGAATVRRRNSPRFGSVLHQSLSADHQLHCSPHPFRELANRLHPGRSRPAGTGTHQSGRHASAPNGARPDYSGDENRPMNVTTSAVALLKNLRPNGACPKSEHNGWWPIHRLQITLRRAVRRCCPATFPLASANGCLEPRQPWFKASRMIFAH